MLTGEETLQDDVRDDAGNVTSEASGIVQGLRAARKPVCVLEKIERARDRAEWKKRVDDVAVARTDWVTVAHFEYVQGLERRVVVWLAGENDMDGDGPADPVHTLFGLSRCTTQLVMVAPSLHDSHTDNNNKTDDSHTPKKGNTGNEDEKTEEKQL